MSNEREGKHGVQSIEIGIEVLRAVVAGEQAMMLKDIGAAAGMPASKAHRYLVSLIRSGMIEQDPISGRYDLGPLALHVGLAAINRIDRIRLGVAAIADLRDEINETTALGVWTDHGPVIVRWERARRPISVNVCTGVALDMLASASGRMFGGHMPEKIVRPLVEKELAEGRRPGDVVDWPSAQAMFAQVRAAGLSVVSGFHLVPGVESMGAPVFNLKGEMTLVMLIIGMQGRLDLDANGRVATALKAAADRLSGRLGAPGYAEPPARMVEAAE